MTIYSEITAHVELASLRKCLVLTISSIFFLVSLVPLPWHLEVPRLGVKLEAQLWAYTTLTATPDPSCICDLHCSSWQCQVLNPLSEARDQTHILMILLRFITTEPWWVLLFTKFYKCRILKNNTWNHIWSLFDYVITWIFKEYFLSLKMLVTYMPRTIKL